VIRMASPHMLLPKLLLDRWAEGGRKGGWGKERGAAKEEWGMVGLD
jgi:hypothetical protein